MNKPLNGYIDHTLLRSDATEKEIRRLCEEAIEFQFATVCIQPVWVRYASQMLRGSPCKVCSVVGFPLGVNTSEIKAAEARQLVELGADELDMVMHVGALKDGDYDLVKRDIQGVVQATHGALVKVIIETCLLTDEEKRLASNLCVEAGAHFVKTSTGFSKSGATVHDVTIIKEAVGAKVGIKASGGIKDRAFAEALIEAGATRLGTSSGVLLVEK